MSRCDKPILSGRLGRMHLFFILGVGEDTHAPGIQRNRKEGRGWRDGEAGPGAAGPASPPAGRRPGNQPTDSAEDPKINDQVLVGLKHCSKLRLLVVPGTRITDAGLAHLKSLGQLEILDLGGTSVSDVGMKHIGGLTRLTSLIVKDTKVTPHGTSQLQKINPRLAILE
jgi:hypothetical protein